MDTEYADAVNQLEDEVDRACNRACAVLSTEELVKELRRIADAWEQEG